MTLTIEELKAIKQPCKMNIEIYSDSSYVVNAFNKKWIDSWKEKGWKNASKEPVKNRELWEKLDELVGMLNVEFIKVKGHSDNEYNNRCDELARKAIENL